MIKILGKSVLCSVLENIEKTTVSNTSVTSMYLSDRINKCCENRKNLTVVKEEKPLGTAGAVKNAYDGKSDCVLVLSGDGILILKKLLIFTLKILVMLQSSLTLPKTLLSTAWLSATTTEK